jgi:hypothetical protein
VRPRQLIELHVEAREAKPEFDRSGQERRWRGVLLIAASSLHQDGLYANIAEHLANERKLEVTGHGKMSILRKAKRSEPSGSIHIESEEWFYKESKR